jgi:hypothetical protein
MTRAAWLSLSLGLALFIGLLVWQGFGPLVSALSLAGFGVIAANGRSPTYCARAGRANRSTV